MAEDTNVVTPKGRVMFPQLFEAKAFKSQPPKFSMTLVFDAEAQKTPQFQKMKEAAEAAARAKFGAKPPKSLKSPFHDGDEKDNSDGQRLAGFEGDVVYINVSSKRQPVVVDRNKVKDENGEWKFPTITDPAAVYEGCYARASLNAYAYDVDGGKGVAFGLNRVQFVEDGPKIARMRTRPEDDFDDVGGKNVSEGDASSIF